MTKIILKLAIGIGGLALALISQHMDVGYTMLLMLVFSGACVGWAITA